MSTVQVRCQALLGLYDVHQKTDGGCATAVSAIAGEELGIALLEHYLRGTGVVANRLPNIPTTGKSKGFRLDGWLETDAVLYQVEVKNWGANAVGGKPYDGNPLPGWKHFEKSFQSERLHKILHPMKYPNIASKLPVQPVACMWEFMHHEGLRSPFFTVPTTKLPTPAFETEFKELHVFSMSSYLRHLGNETLDLNMPVSAQRLQRLQTIFVIDC